MTALHWSLVLAGAGLGTYALRVTPFLWRRLYRLGQENLRFLAYVSFAIAAGIVSRSVMFAGGQFDAPGDVGIKIAAVLGALLLRQLTRSLPVALFGGVGIAILLKWLTL